MDIIRQWNVPKREKDLVLRALSTLMLLFEKLSTLQMTIKQLRKMFHIKTEKARNIIPSSDIADIDDTTSTSEKKKRKKRKSGRRKASDYKGAKIVFIPHDALRTGERCPDCNRGNLYDITGPGFVHIVGQAPLQATLYKWQKLRCSGCGTIHKTSSLPKESSSETSLSKREKYDATAKAMIALLKYGSGFPFYRLNMLQTDLGIPLPPSTQWDLMQDLAMDVIPAYQAIYTMAAQADLIYNDDTFARILKMPLHNESKGEKRERTGLFTTGIVSLVEGYRITLYCTGRKHAGENIQDLLFFRLEGRAPPIQMCDAAARNVPKITNTHLANCLIHGRRKFVELIDTFPDPCSYVIQILGKVFHHESITRKEKLSAGERLVYHQEKSAPLMKNLKQWMNKQFKERLVEPNSSLGKAFNYMLNHWEKLTLFLHMSGVPIDSNIVERALKRVILHRKNAYFYVSEGGALVGDMFMSLIETCKSNGINPFDYLTTLQRYHHKVKQNPDRWLPWNYQEQIIKQQAA